MNNMGSRVRKTVIVPLQEVDKHQTVLICVKTYEALADESKAQKRLPTLEPAVLQAEWPVEGGGR